jgi:hypothetical protein
VGGGLRVVESIVQPFGRSFRMRGKKEGGGEERGDDGSSHCSFIQNGRQEEGKIGGCAGREGHRFIHSFIHSECVCMGGRRKGR